jgi:hypothetical protein
MDIITPTFAPLVSGAALPFETSMDIWGEGQAKKYVRGLLAVLPSGTALRVVIDAALTGRRVLQMRVMQTRRGTSARGNFCACVAVMQSGSASGMELALIVNGRNISAASVGGWVDHFSDRNVAELVERWRVMGVIVDGAVLRVDALARQAYAVNPKATLYRDKRAALADVSAATKRVKYLTAEVEAQSASGYGVRPGVNELLALAYAWKNEAMARADAAQFRMNSAGL